MGNKTLIRPDGSEVRVPDTEAGHLLVLGYKEKTGGQVLEQGINQGTEEHYTTPLQKLMTLQEGADSGGSLGISDLVFGNEGSSARARYNPGVRLGGEIAGTVVGSLAGEGVLNPVGKLTSLAAEAGEAVGQGSKVVSSLVRGTVEGAGFGAGSALTTAKLDGDPVTAEAILAGMGQGALWGGGLSVLGAGVENRIEARLAKRAAEDAALSTEEKTAQGIFKSTEARYNSQIEDTLKLRDKDAALRGVEDEGFSSLNNSFRDATETLKSTSREVEQQVAPDFTKLKMSQRKIYGNLVDQGLMTDKGVQAIARGFEDAFTSAQDAAKAGEFDKMEAQLTRFKEKMTGLENKLGGKTIFDAGKVVGQAEELMGAARQRVEAATAATKTTAEITAVHTTLSGFPKTAAEFAGMTEGKVERLAAAVDKLQGLRVGEFAGVQEAVGRAVDDFGGKLGVTLEGTPGQKLQAQWKLLREGRSARAVAARKAAEDGQLLWKRVDSKADRMDSVKAQADRAREMKAGMSPGERGAAKAMSFAGGAWMGKKLGMGYPGYILGSQLVMGLVGLKGAVLGTLGGAAMKYTPKAMRLLQTIGPRLEPLAQRLDGTMDEAGKDKRELLASRMREINDAAPAVRDTLYRAVEPLGIEHPELAAALHTLGVERFQFLMSKMPKDPGLAYSKLRTLWKPDAVEGEKFARYYEAFHDPVGVLTRAVATGKLTNEAAEGVKEMNPELWTHFRSILLERLSDPKVMAKVSYNDQVHLGLLTGIAFHASMDPRFIAASQQMHTERNKPLEMNPRIQPGGGAGRPSGPGPSATSAQRITEH